VRIVSDTESTTTETIEEEEVPEEELEEEEEIEEQPLLKKMVDRLIKQAKRNKSFKAKGLAGKTLEEQFTILEFYLDNLPKIKSKNRKIVAQPTSYGTRDMGGVTVTDNPITGKKSYSIDPLTLFKQTK